MIIVTRQYKMRISVNQAVNQKRNNQVLCFIHKYLPFPLECISNNREYNHSLVAFINFYQEEATSHKKILKDYVNIRVALIFNLRFILLSPRHPGQRWFHFMKK